MPKRHVSSFFYGLTSNPADFSYYSPHYTIYLFCIYLNIESTKKKGVVKRKHRASSIKEKVEILKKLDSNMSKQSYLL